MTPCQHRRHCLRSRPSLPNHHLDDAEWVHLAEVKGPPARRLGHDLPHPLGRRPRCAAAEITRFPGCAERSGGRVFADSRLTARTLGAKADRTGRLRVRRGGLDRADTWGGGHGRAGRPGWCEVAHHPVQLSLGHSPPAVERHPAVAEGHCEHVNRASSCAMSDAGRVGPRRRSAHRRRHPDPGSRTCTRSGGRLGSTGYAGRRTPGAEAVPQKSYEASWLRSDGSETADRRR
jgi:hypothetical protein